MPSSSAINPGDDLLSAQFNALRDDVLDEASGHPHSGAAGGGVRIHHGATTGLGDDDHPQYPGHAQTETISGAWTFTGIMRVPSGTEFPGAPTDGSLFYRTDQDLLYVYDGAGWERIQNHAVDVAVEQVGSPTYEDAQDWINTTQSAGLISGGVGTATSYAIATADEVAETFTIAGDVTAYFTNGVVFTVSGSTGNDGDYTTVGNSTFGGGVTTITVADVPDGTDDGNIADGRVDVALGAGMVKKTDDAIDGVTAFFNWPATSNILLVDNKVNWVYATYGGGTPAVAATDDHSIIDFTTEFVIFVAYREGTVLHIMQAGLYIFDAFRSMARRVRELRRIERASGAIISDEGTLKIKVTAAVLYSVMTRIATSEVDTSGAGRFRAWYHDGGGNWTSTGYPADQTDIDSAQYDTGTGLAALAANRYGTYWVFLDFDSHLHVVYGRASYKLNEAQADTVPAIPDICSEFAVLVARIIAFKDAPEILEASSAFKVIFVVTDHFDPNAIHDNLAAEITAIAEKAAPVDADVLIIEDSEAANVKKKVQVVNLPGGADPNAIHDNVAGEIIAIAEKVAPIAADVLLIEDTEAANAKKRVQISNLPTGADADAIHDNVAGEILAVAEKAAPVDADVLLIEDTEAANVKKRVTIANLPGGADPNAVHVNVAAEIAGVDEKAAPVSADLVIIEDSAAANAKKKVQVGNLPGAGILHTGLWLNPSATIYSTSAYAWKGNYDKPMRNILIHALGVKGDWPQGITLKFGVFTVAGGVIAAVVHKSTGITLPAAFDVNPSAAWVWETFSTPWALTAGTLYLIMVGCSSGAGNYALPIAYPAELHPAPFPAHENAIGSGRVADADPLVDDAVNDFAGTAHLGVTWEFA